VLLWTGYPEVVVDGLHHGRRKFLGGEAITAANNPGEGFQATVAFVHAFVQSVHNIEVQRFTTTAGLFGPVQHRDVANAWGERLQETPG